MQRTSAQLCVTLRLWLRSACKSASKLENVKPIPHGTRLSHPRRLVFFFAGRAGRRLGALGAALCR